MKRRRKKMNAVSFFAFQDIITAVVGIFVLITLIMVLELAQTVSEAKASPATTISPDIIASLASLREEVMQLESQQSLLSRSANSRAAINEFNREDIVAELELQIEQTNDRIERAEQIARESKQSLVQAKKVHEQMIAESKAAESERHELEDLQDKRQELERYSSVLEIDQPLIFRDTTQDNRWLVLVQLVDHKIKVSESQANQSYEYSGLLRIERFEQWLSSVNLAQVHILVIIKPSGVDDFAEIKSALQSSSARFGFDLASEEANFLLRSEVGPKP